MWRVLMWSFLLVLAPAAQLHAVPARPVPDGPSARERLAAELPGATPDPVFQTLVTLFASPSLEIRDVKVAYEPDTDRFLVVWEHASRTSAALYAQKVASDGTLIGDRITVKSGRLRLGGVATDNSSNVFIIVWDEINLNDNSDVHAMAIRAENDGSATLAIAATDADEFSPVIAGERGHLSAFFPIIYREASPSGASLRIQTVLFNSAGLLGKGISGTLSDGPNDSFPSISRNGGFTGRFLATWTRDGQIYGKVFDRALITRAPEFLISPDDGADRVHSVVDGDGTSWLVAYSRQAGSDQDVVCRRVVMHLAGGEAAPEGPEVAVAATPGSESAVDITRMGESYVLAYTSSTSSGIAPALASIDPAECTDCEGRWVLGSSSERVGFDTVGIAHPLSGGPGNAGPALAAFAGTDGAAVVVQALIFSEVDGVTTRLEGGCGRVGTPLASCARVGHQDFALRLQGAPASSPVLLGLGTKTIDLPCGPCVLVSEPMAVIHTSTTPAGTAQVSLAIPVDPSLQGFTLVSQWFMPDPIGECLGLLDFSSALEIVIQR